MFRGRVSIPEMQGLASCPTADQLVQAILLINGCRQLAVPALAVL
jgi:hypothetical protein